MSVEWYSPLRRMVLRIGDAQGIGFLREQELIESVGYFGINDVETLNHKYIYLVIWRTLTILGNYRIVWIMSGPRHSSRNW